MDKASLENAISKLIQESGLTYGEVISAIEHLHYIYRGKGNNLLNATNIQKVANP